jgi:hypothetical protein
LDCRFAFGVEKLFLNFGKINTVKESQSFFPTERLFFYNHFQGNPLLSVYFADVGKTRYKHLKLGTFKVE